MLTTAHNRDTLAPSAHSSAVVWINRREAVVAATRLDGGIEVEQISAAGAETLHGYLARVVDVIGERERLMILGPGSARTALEREYAETFRGPERLIDVEPADRRQRDHVVERLLVFAH
jgi:hypothetical protein